MRISFGKIDKQHKDYLFEKADPGIRDQLFSYITYNYRLYPHSSYVLSMKDFNPYTFIYRNLVSRISEYLDQAQINTFLFLMEYVEEG